MTSIDDLLHRALLVREPSVPGDVVPYEDVSVPVRLDDLTPWPASRLVGRGPAGGTAAHDLQTLCETVVNQTAATSLQDFVTEQLPEPSGARVLGCILQLTDAEDGARFWWQYAAGAGDNAASYCLYLHHLSLGETHAAAWWRKQTSIDTQPAPETVPLPGDQESITNLDSSIPTVLRVLSQLASQVSRSRTEVVDAVMEYVPAAVAAGYLVDPDCELPLPVPDFAVQIAIIVATASALRAGTTARPEYTPPRLARRQRRPAGGTGLHKGPHVNTGPGVSNAPGPTNAPVNSGPMNNAPLNNGPMNNAPLNNGPMGNGPMKNGSLSNGTASTVPLGKGPGVHTASTTRVPTSSTPST